MTRDEIYKEMREVFGRVPSFFETIPDALLEHEWKLGAALMTDQGPIPIKYLHLISLAVGAALGSEHSVYADQKMARLVGATDEEIEWALQMAKFTSGWAVYNRGRQIPLEEFKRDVDRAEESFRRLMESRKEERKAA